MWWCGYLRTMRVRMRHIVAGLLIVAALTIASCASAPDATGSALPPPTHPVTDFDGDGLLDWEDPDDDNDGATDEEEISSGSDPRDPASLPER